MISLIIKERGSIAQMGRRTMAADAMAEDVSRIVCVAAAGTRDSGPIYPSLFWIDVKSPTNCNHSR